MNRPALTARRVRGLAYIVKRLGGSGAPARRVFGKVKGQRGHELTAALLYLEQLVQWHEWRQGKGGYVVDLVDEPGEVSP